MKADTDMLENMKKLIGNLNFWFMLISFALAYSSYSTLGAIVGPVTDKFGYTSNETSIFGVCFIVFGVLGSFIHAIMLDKYKMFKKQFLIVLGSSFLAYFLLIGSMPTGISVLVAICLGIFGFCLIPVIGVGFSFTAINFSPISAAASCGIANMLNAVVGCGLTAVVSIFYTESDDPDKPTPGSYKWIGLGILSGSVFIGLIIGLLIKENVN